MTCRLNASAVNIPDSAILEGDMVLGVRCSKHYHLYIFSHLLFKNPGTSSLVEPDQIKFNLLNINHIAQFA